MAREEHEEEVSTWKDFLCLLCKFHGNKNVTTISTERGQSNKHGCFAGTVFMCLRQWGGTIGAGTTVHKEMNEPFTGTWEFCFAVF